MKAPLAYLLSLSDKLQDWDRYSIGRPVFPPSKYDIKVDSKLQKIIFQVKINERKNEIFNDVNLSLTGLDIAIT